jgi:hypothetical protein
MEENRHWPLTATHWAPWPKTSISIPVSAHRRISSREHSLASTARLIP